MVHMSQEKMSPLIFGVESGYTSFGSWMKYMKKAENEMEGSRRSSTLGTEVIQEVLSSRLLLFQRERGVAIQPDAPREAPCLQSLGRLHCLIDGFLYGLIVIESAVYIIPADVRVCLSLQQRFPGTGYQHRFVRMMYRSKIESCPLCISTQSALRWYSSLLLRICVSDNKGSSA